MIETEHGNFELIKEHRESFDVKSFNERYVDYLDRYQYIVGDISAEILRLKGFNEENKHLIDDYIMESTALNASYYILKRIVEDKN